MRLAVVGVGGAGSRLANRIVDVERSTGRNLTDGNTLLVYADPPTFDAAERIPEERHLVIGDVHGTVADEGTGGDADLGAEVAREERNEIVRTFDAIEFHQIDGVLVTAGLAGGLGGGAGAVLLDQLQDICDEPIYAVGALPAADEGPAAALTAARSLQSFVERADTVVPLDNETWQDEVVDDEEAADEREGAVDGSGYARANEALARRIVTLFAAGEFDDGAAPETRLDPSDVVRTLEIGGVSSIGYASTDVPPGGYRSWLRAARDRLPWTSPPEEPEPTDAAKINQLVRRAAHSTLTLPCEVESADRALIVLSGPSRALSRKGFESGRYWLEEEADIVEVKAGDEPHDRSSTLSATVLFANVTDVPRIDRMQEQAVSGRQAASADGGMRFGGDTDE